MDIELRKARYKDVFGTKHGKEVLEDLCNIYHLNSTTYRKDGNVEDTIYREGQRSVILFLLSQINQKEK